VQRAEEQPPAEAGDGVVTLRVESDRDVREELCRALVGEGFGILQVGAGERELESIFLRLAGSPSKKKRKKKAAEAPKVEEAAAPSAESPEADKGEA
jgi:hypothetical protein